MIGNLKISGVYKIESKVHPDRCYIGSAVNVRHRLQNHISDLNLKKHHSRQLQNHFNKYGKDDLLISLVAICDETELIPVNGVIEIEQSFIISNKYKDSLKPFFNNAPTAGSNYGFRHSEESKKKNSDSNKGKPSWNKGKTKETDPRIRGREPGFHHSDETIKKISDNVKGKLLGEKHPMFGKHHDEEMRYKCGNGNRGKKQTEEQILKRITPLIGRKMPPEFGENISKRMMGNTNSKGHKHTEETIAIIKEKRKLQVFSAESIQKMSDSHKGKKQSEEQKQKKSASLLEFYRKKREGELCEK